MINDKVIEAAKAVKAEFTPAYAESSSCDDTIVFTHKQLTKFVELLQSQSEPVAWQFFQDDKWYNGMDEKHKKNTIEAGYPVRELFTHPPLSVNEQDKAIQQFIGFHHANEGYDVIALVESMALTTDEFEAIKYDVCVAPYLDEISEYFKAIANKKAGE